MGIRQALTFTLACSASAGVAHAEDASVVRIGGTCMPAGTSITEVLRILEAELAPMQVAPIETMPPAATDTDLVLGIDTCSEAPSGARVTLWRHGERRERLVRLGDTGPGTRDRTLALALAETLRDPAVTHPADRADSAPSITPTTTAGSPLGTETTERRHALSAPSMVPRASILFRFAPATSTPALGVDAAVAWKQAAVGIAVLGAHRTTSLGTATIVAVAGTASFDPLELGPVVRLRVIGEIGVAVGSGSPKPSAVSHSAIALHTALTAGIAPVVPLERGWAADAFAGGGYASSLTAESDGHDALGIHGAFLTVALGVRFP